MCTTYTARCCLIRPVCDYLQSKRQFCIEHNEMWDRLNNKPEYKVEGHDILENMNKYIIFGC